MDWLTPAGSTVGPTARTYTLPLVSVTDVTVATASLQPTTTTFRFPLVCAAGYTTPTCVPPVGSPAFTCTKVTLGGGGAVAWVVALAVLEYGPRLFAESLA